VAGHPPLIGLTGFGGLWNLDCGRYPVTSVETGYTDLISDAGGLPVILTSRAAAAADLVARIDALLLTGGPDVDPGAYGHRRDPRTGSPDALRDALELALVREAFRSGKPVLAVCRGCQLVNVAFGGTLNQHVDGHAALDRPGDPVHEVSLLEGSLLSQLLGADRIGVNSLHHQSVDRLAPELVASARARHDDSVEAIEHPGAPLLAVQWHPEKQQDLKPAHVLFQWLVDQAVTRRADSTHYSKGY
jgi:putative glutamine amidotransferase